MSYIVIHEKLVTGHGLLAHYYGPFTSRIEAKTFVREKLSKGHPYKVMALLSSAAMKDDEHG